MRYMPFKECFAYFLDGELVEAGGLVGRRHLVPDKPRRYVSFNSDKTADRSIATRMHDMYTWVCIAQNVIFLSLPLFFQNGIFPPKYSEKLPFPPYFNLFPLIFAFFSFLINYHIFPPNQKPMTHIFPGGGGEKYTPPHVFTMTIVIS